MANDSNGFEAQPLIETGSDAAQKARIGIEGLDEVLVGGLARNRLYLVEGNPGTGKTTVALQFLIEGQRNGERCLYVTLSESEAELRANAASHGWDLAGIDTLEVLTPESLLDDTQRQTLLYTSDLELGETTRQILDAVDRLKPTRVVIDSLSEIRLLAQSSLRYRRQILAMKQYFARHTATVLLLDDLTSEEPEKAAHSIAHGVLRLEQLPPVYGDERRRLRISKYRGQASSGGFHDFKIVRDGVRVFPRLVASDHHAHFTRRALESGIDELDALLGGGLDYGTSMLMMGPAGVGKTLLALHFIQSAVRGGQRAAIFEFDEEIALLMARAEKIGIDLVGMRERGEVLIEQIDSAQVSPGEFAHRVRHCVEHHGASFVFVDSLNGYYAAMPEERYLILHMHELLAYLNRQGVITVVAMAQQGMIGEMKSPVDVTYLSDSVLMLRFFEARGRMRRALSVLKKRSGAHEDTIREFRIDPRGIRLGEPLIEFEGVMRGTPTYVGRDPALLEERAR